MKALKSPILLAWLVALGGTAASTRAELVINEILFNPPGSDAPNQYIELRGTPNLVIPDGTWLVAVAGDADSNPGTIRDVFDLSGRSVGGNGFLVLLQKATPYLADTNATMLVNTDNGPGWGSGASSSVGHRGAAGQTDLGHASATFVLLQTTNAPLPGTDLDSDNDGIPDGPAYASWTVLDSVGVLGPHGAGDIAYGAINFKRDTANGALASGTIVPVGFTPRYVGRAGNTIGATAAAWVASDNLGGAAPNWTLGPNTNTVPSGFAGAPLNHLGAANFGAPAIPGVLLYQAEGRFEVVEDGTTASYALALNTKPSGPVTIRIEAETGVQVSTNDGRTFDNSRALTLTNQSPRTVMVRAVNDNIVDTSPHTRWVSQAVSATADPAQYPLTTIIPSVKVHVMETETLLLNELKVNPPGANDAPWEFVEIKGPPDALLTNVYFLAIESRASRTPGRAELVVDLTSARVGDSGLLVISATNDPYHIPRDATLWSDPRFNQAGSALGNGATSFLLVTSPKPIEEGTDLDVGNNGKLEGLPNGTTVLDSVAFGEGDTNDVFYTSAVLILAQGAPDAASRWPTNNTSRSAAAWFCGALSGAASESLVFDSSNLSTNFPAGVVLTPGAANDISLTVTGVEARSGVIADPTNPGLSFTVADANSANAAGLIVTATSTDPAVIPDANLTIVSGSSGLRTLYLDPVGVGYSTITITVSNGAKVGQIGFPYAASAMGRPGGIFHTGTADGSTAIAIDAHLMFVGDNENQVIRLYDRHRSGPPVAAFDFQAFLDVGAQERGEVNIEGSTRVGNRFFWIGAHSNSNLGEGRTNRARMFATDLIRAGAGAQLGFVGYYEYLKADMTHWDSTNGHGKGTNYYGLAASAADNINPKAPSGFNIEGLSMAPDSTNAAYVGFRAPIVPPIDRTCALIVPVLNFADLAAHGGPPGSAIFGAPIELDLYGRGIRSLEGTTNGYLIAAGPPGDDKSGYPNDFRLYTWTGNPSDMPQQRSADLSGLRSEGIAELPPLPWTSDTLVQLITDSGTTVPYDDGIQDKHLPIPAFKEFRSDWVALASVVKPAPVILAIQRDGIEVTLTWRALKGESYQVQTTIDLGQAAWQDLPGEVKATGPRASKVLSLDLDRQRFYRVTLAP